MTDPGHTRKAFPLADILSVTTGVLVSRRKMDGLCELVAFLTNTAPSPRFMSPADVLNLSIHAQAAKAELIRQYPFLAELAPPAGLDDTDLYGWLIQVEETHGLELTVRCPHNHLTPRQVAAFDQLDASVKDGAAKIQASLGRFTDALSDAAKKMNDLAAALQSEPEQADDERTTP